MSFFAKYPKHSGILGLFFAMFFGSIGISSGLEYLDMPEEPETVNLVQAAEILHSDNYVWIEIDQIKWDCQNVLQRDHYTGDFQTEILFSNDAKTILGIAEFPTGSEIFCEDLSTTGHAGVISKLRNKAIDLLPDRGFNLTAYQDIQLYMRLCLYCGRTNAKNGFIAGIGLALLGLLFYPLALIARRTYRKKGLL